MRRLVNYIFCTLFGWNIQGTFPDRDQFIVIAAPHTSNWDFIVGLTVRYILNVKINYLGKSSLFKWPWGWFFRATGGAPVDRSNKRDTVSVVVDLFKKNKRFRLALAPEGTRKKVDEWRSGFYYIALGAEVPIVMISMDFASKTIGISKPFYPSGEKEKDFIEIKSFYKGVVGKIPQNT